MTILMHAVSKKYGYPFVEYLLKIGCDIDAVDNHNRSAIMLACHWHRNKIAHLILDYNPDLNFVASKRVLPF